LPKLQRLLATFLWLTAYTLSTAGSYNTDTDSDNV